MAVTLCQEPCRRGITHGPILLHLGRDIFTIAPQIKFCEVLVTRPFPVGFHANQDANEAVAAFLAQFPPDPIMFFNVGIFLSGPPQGEAGGTLNFFNVAEEVEDIGFLQAGGTILFFNVGEVDTITPGEAGGTLLFFNISSEGQVC